MLGSRRHRIEVETIWSAGCLRSIECSRSRCSLMCRVASRRNADSLPARASRRRGAVASGRPFARVKALLTFTSGKREVLRPPLACGLGVLISVYTIPLGTYIRPYTDSASFNESHKALSGSCLRHCSWPYWLRDGMRLIVRGSKVAVRPRARVINN